MSDKLFLNRFHIPGQIIQFTTHLCNKFTIVADNLFLGKTIKLPTAVNSQYYRGNQCCTEQRNQYLFPDGEFQEPMTPSKKLIVH